MHYSGDLNNKHLVNRNIRVNKHLVVPKADGCQLEWSGPFGYLPLNNKLKVCYSGHGLNSKLNICYSSHENHATHN